MREQAAKDGDVTKKSWKQSPGRLTNKQITKRRILAFEERIYKIDVPFLNRLRSFVQRNKAAKTDRRSQKNGRNEARGGTVLAGAASRTVAIKFNCP